MMKLVSLTFLVVWGFICAERAWSFAIPASHQLLVGKGLGTVQSRVCPTRENGCSSVLKRIKRSRGEALHMRGGLGNEVPVGSRILGTLPYLLPVLDGLDNGKYLFKLFPGLRDTMYTMLMPGIALWEHIPFLPLVVFILLTIFARQPGVPRLIRFNIQQAILVDLGLVLFSLLDSLLSFLVPMGEASFTNFTFYCLMAAILYATTENMSGRVPNQIPLISAVAEMQIGPN
ncbi:unnamed protein product [Choristocarpus tenellus]